MVVSEVGSYGSSVNYIGGEVHAGSIVDLENISLAIGSRLISRFAVFLLSLSLSLFLRFLFRSLSLSRHITLTLGLRDNSYVLRMHNVPNYFTLLLLRVINARRLARERVHPVSCARDLPLRDHESPTDTSSLSLFLGLSARRTLLGFFFRLSAISSTRSSPARIVSAVFFPLDTFSFSLVTSSRRTNGQR